MLDKAWTTGVCNLLTHQWWRFGEKVCNWSYLALLSQVDTWKWTKRRVKGQDYHVIHAFCQVVIISVSLSKKPLVIECLLSKMFVNVDSTLVIM